MTEQNKDETTTPAVEVGKNQPDLDQQQAQGDAKEPAPLHDGVKPGEKKAGAVDGAPVKMQPLEAPESGDATKVPVAQPKDGDQSQSSGSGQSEPSMIQKAATAVKHAVTGK